MKLETSRLVLRSATRSDAANIQHLFSNPEVSRYLPPRAPLTLEEAGQFVDRRVRMEAERGYAPLIIESRDGSVFLGSGGLLPAADTQEAEIAYHFLPSAWGKGYATEAARSILDSPGNRSPSPVM
jgi:RimJ/RimL family protein N-acetyltransferase